MTSPILNIRGLCKRFSDDQRVIDGLSLSVADGEFVCVLGSSGCGKTTMLRLVSGFETPDEGEIEHQGQIIARTGWGLRPEQRRIGMVFQDYALFPHLTVRGNVRFGLEPSLRGRIAQWMRPDWRVRHVREAARRTEELMEMTGLTRFAERYPHELSGGQLQRIALARALAPGASLMLLDEPFSNLDSNLRQRLREEVKEVLKNAGVTTILVTHDQEEALNLADRIAVMNQGRIEQVGPPEEILHKPRTRFVAAFTGMSNLLPGRITGGKVETELGCFPLPGDYDLSRGERVEVLLRPTYFQFASDGDGVPARIVRIDYMGAQRVYTLEFSTGSEVRAVFPGRLELRTGDIVPVAFRPPDLTLFPMEV